MPLSLIGLSTFKAALRVADTADDTQLLRDLEYVSDLIERETKRWFQPRTATLYFQARASLAHDLVAARHYATTLAYAGRASDRLLVDAFDLLTVTSLRTLTTNSSGTRTYGDTWAVTDYDLYPLNAQANREPYWEIRANPQGSYRFPADERGIEIIGTWGYWSDTASAGTLGAAISTTTATSVTMTAGHSVQAGHTLLIETEQLYVSTVATNTLTVERAQNGTTAATHANSTAVSRYRYPGVVEQACIDQGQQAYRGHDAPFGQIGGGEWTEPVRLAFRSGLHPFVRRMLDLVRRVEPV